MLKLSSDGRGGRFSVARGLIESTLRVAYRGDWPAWLWQQVPHSRRVRVVRRTLPLLPAGCPPLTVGFISDLHIGPTTAPATLDAAFAPLVAEQLDLLLLGGDYVFLDATLAKAAELERRVAAVPATTKLAVMGNHDLWADHPVLEKALVRAGATVMVNSAVCLPEPHGQVAVVGLDDPWTGEPDPDQAFSAAGDAPVKILLCHAPEGLPLVGGRGVQLMMCGHTHGGHIAGPSGPIVVHGHIGRHRPSGFYQVGGMQLFVSRGVGGIETPIRTFAPPDIAIITLTAAAHDN